MSLIRFLSPLVCAAGLLVVPACGSDDPTTSEESSSVKADGGGKVKPRADAGVDGGKTNTVTRDGKVDTKPDDDDDNAGGCGSVKAAAELERGPVDIVLALDSSGSMAGQICNVSTNLTAFAAGVGENAHVVGFYQMGILGLTTQLLCGTADPLAATPLAMDPDRYFYDSVNVDSWNALTQLNAAFDSYKSFLRPNAATHFVIVSDDESDPLRGGMTATDFKTQMEQKLGHSFYFHAIVADGKDGCRGSNVGTQYLELAAQTGGETLPICATDWTVLFKQLESAVVSSAPIPCDFAIPAEPSNAGTLDTSAVQVVFTPPGGNEEQFPLATGADKCGAQTAWYYNDPADPTRIELCPAACESVKQGGDVNIAFGCEPIIAL
jgi:hypothetical protein